MVQNKNFIPTQYLKKSKNMPFGSYLGNFNPDSLWIQNYIGMIFLI